MFEAINTFVRMHPILSLLIIIWSLGGLVHFVGRRNTKDVGLALCYTALEGPILWAYVLFIIVWTTVIVVPFVTFVKFVKSI